jgi:predicted ATP-dependent protease
MEVGILVADPGRVKAVGGVVLTIEHRREEGGWMIADC